MAWTPSREQVRILTERGPSARQPLSDSHDPARDRASMVAIEFGFTGPNMAVTSACATGANAIGEA